MMFFFLGGGTKVLILEYHHGTCILISTSNAICMAAGLRRGKNRENVFSVNGVSQDLPTVPARHTHKLYQSRWTCDKGEKYEGGNI
jgi:hypothetical protein